MQSIIVALFVPLVDIKTRYILEAPHYASSSPCAAYNITLVVASDGSTQYYNNGRSVIVYLIIFVMAQLFQFLMVLDTVWFWAVDLFYFLIEWFY